jgi:methyltransferase
MHPDLRHAALLKSMDIPHHQKIEDRLPYREGITLPSSKGTLIDVGYDKFTYNQQIDPYTRVTVDMSLVEDDTPKSLTNARIVEVTEPRTKHGYYWGYATRQASSLSSVFAESPFENGYDFVIGTSERGTSLAPALVSTLPRFAHLLIVLGGQSGIEAAVENDENLALKPENACKLFDWWVNCVPGQGSRTIRTEEAIWIVLGQMFGEIQRKGIR